MWQVIWRELCYLRRAPWDLAMVTLAPLLVIVLISSMFSSGKAEHLPIAVIDQDHGQLSQTIQQRLQLNTSLQVAYTTTNPHDVEHLLNQNQIWGYVLIPTGAEQRLLAGEDAHIGIAFNQSYFSIGNTISTAMLVSTLGAIAEFTGEDYLANTLPALDAPSPHLKISPLYNPQMNYEFYLEPYMVPAILHLLLCCCVAFAVGQEFKQQGLKAWVQQHPMAIALWGKIIVYVLIFSVWTWLWMFWLIVIRGWFVAGTLLLILVAQFFFYSAYALLSTAIVLATRDLAKSFGLIAVYGGSSLSFAGVTLPLNNAPLFTQFWTHIIPYTPYARLQTEQWVMGSPISISLPALFSLIGYVLLCGLLCDALLRKRHREVHV